MMKGHAQEMSQISMIIPAKESLEKLKLVAMIIPLLVIRHIVRTDLHVCWGLERSCTCATGVKFYHSTKDLPLH